MTFILFFIVIRLGGWRFFRQSSVWQKEYRVYFYTLLCLLVPIFSKNASSIWNSQFDLSSNRTFDSRAIISFAKVLKLSLFYFLNFWIRMKLISFAVCCLPGLAMAYNLMSLIIPGSAITNFLLRNSNATLNDTLFTKF